MKRSIFIVIREWFASFSKKPWACFETTGPNEYGRVGFSISWNKAFVDNLYQLGMGGMTDEETVQLFFLQMRMHPEEIEDPDSLVSPSAMPQLTSEANSYRRG